VTVGVKNLTLAAGVTKQVAVSLNARGRRLLRKTHRLRVSLTALQTLNGTKKLVASRSLRFKVKANPKRR
jgi:hypothetical protein